MHTHNWRLMVDGPDCKECQYQAVIGVAVCGCGEQMGTTQIERRLNAVEMLPAKFAVEIAMGIEESGLGRITSDAPILRAYARILEGETT